MTETSQEARESFDNWLKSVSAELDRDHATDPAALWDLQTAVHGRIRKMAHELALRSGGPRDRPGDPVALKKTPSWRECCDREEHDRQTDPLSRNRARCARGKSSASARNASRLHAAVLRVSAFTARATGG